MLQHFFGKERSANYLRKKKHILYQDILKNEGIENRGRTIDVKEVECTDLQPYIKDREELMKGPLVFRGVAKEWPCVKKWNKEYFRQYFSDYKVSLVGNVGLADKENQNKFTEASMADFIDTIGKDKNNYLRFSRIIDERADLKKDIDVDWLDQFKYEFSRGGYLYLFMGEAGSKTDMHNAIIQSLFIQVKGQKKWTIYAPNERIFLDPIADRRPYFYSQANPNNPGDSDFPLLSYAIKYEITLDEGDILWFPSFFWHHVQNLTPNIGVTYKFTDFSKSFEVSKILTSLFFLATKPTLLESFYYNTFKKRDLLFDNH
jgi:hypothetical protein